MITFAAIVKKFGSQGEKTGWTYIDVCETIAQQLMPGHKKAFRVRGKIDTYEFAGVSLVPMGGGDFIMALNATMRRGVRKPIGATLSIQLEVDTTPVQLNKELLDCLEDEPAALINFKKLPPSHQKYYSNWVESAKTDVTKAKRIASAVSACVKGQQYGEMIRELKKNNDNNIPVIG